MEVQQGKPLFVCLTKRLPWGWERTADCVGKENAALRLRIEAIESYISKLQQAKEAKP